MIIRSPDTIIRDVQLGDLPMMAFEYEAIDVKVGTRDNEHAFIEYEETHVVIVEVCL